MNGIDIKLLSEKTGAKEDTIKKWMKRFPELCDPPYSRKVGGYRVFFRSMYDWIMARIGKGTKVDIVSTFVHQKKLPSGAQLNALLKIYPTDELKKRIDYVLGYIPQGEKSPQQPFKSLPTPLQQDFESYKNVVGKDTAINTLQKVMYNHINSKRKRISREKNQLNLLDN